MRLSYNWLKQYVDLTGVSPKELAERITSAGLEVEGVEQVASGTNLCIGHVESCVDIEGTHLHQCMVNVGTDVRQIVCGAPNVAAGENVIVALPGCVLPAGTISAGKIRGYESNGMICSLSELGVDKKQLTEEQLSGIEILPEDAPVGSTDVLAYLSLDDTILDVSLTPNRNDCLSMWAMAKEVAAILDRKAMIPDTTCHVEEVPSTLKVESKTEKCPVFLGKIINSITIKESPKWIKDALQGAGIKSINNVVDISNLVMLETGQPLHFYDVAKIPTREITVVDDLAETYTALDGIDYSIAQGDIMITTGGKAIGIAGIMGGDDSKIDEQTQGIIIEAAQFNHVSIRLTSRRLNLSTEAATHFIKGVEPLAGVKAMARSVQLLVEYADAKCIEQTVVAGTIHDEVKTISLTLEHVNRVLGTNFDMETAISPLARLDLNPHVEQDIITVTVPSYRMDLNIAEDVIEEIIRVLGFDHIVSTLPMMPSTIGKLATNERKRRTIKTVLNGLGLTEIVTYSLVSKHHIEHAVMPLDGVVELKNPLSDERRYYRTSLMPSLLDTVAYNQARNAQNWGMFEIANVFDGSYQMQEHLSMALSTSVCESNWQKLQVVGDFYLLKGKIMAIMDELGFDERRISFKPNMIDTTTFHPMQSAEIYLGKDLIGVFGRVHPKTAQAYDIENVCVAELNLSILYAAQPAKIKFKPLCKYPSVSYDLSMLVSQDVTVGQILDIVRKQGGRLLKNTEVFDIYQGKGIADGMKSVAIRIVYQSEEKTLTDQDLIPIQEKIMTALNKQLQAVLRG